TARRNGGVGCKGGKLLGADHLGQEAIRRRQRDRQADRRGDAGRGDRPARRHRPRRRAHVTLAAASGSVRPRPIQTWLVVWAAALATVLIVFLAQDSIPWAVDYPAHAVVP